MNGERCERSFFLVSLLLLFWFIYLRENNKNYNQITSNFKCVHSRLHYFRNMFVNYFLLFFLGRDDKKFREDFQLLVCFVRRCGAFNKNKITCSHREIRSMWPNTNVLKEKNIIHFFDHRTFSFLKAKHITHLEEIILIFLFSFLVWVCSPLCDFIVTWLFFYFIFL